MSHYEFTLSKALTVGHAQDFILRFNPPVPMRAEFVSTNAPPNIITVSECFMAGEDARKALDIRGFGVDAASLVSRTITGPTPRLGPSAGVSIKCWYNGDEPEGYRTGERLHFTVKFIGPRLTSVKGEPIGGKL